MRKTYPSDVTREQFENIRSVLGSVRKKTHPRTLDTYDVFNAVLYVLKTGCQWSALPHDFPKYQTVHTYFMKWSEEKKGSVLVLLCQAVFAQANSYRLMNKPMIMSCIKIFLEKHIVFRANRLMRVLSVRFFRSIFCVFSLPTLWFSGSR